MSSVELIYGYEEREYWLEQLDRLMLMKIRYERGIEIEDYSLCSQVGSPNNNTQEIFTDTLTKVLAPTPIQVLQLSESDENRSVLMKLYFPFKKVVSNEDSTTLEKIKDQMSRCFQNLNYETFSSWDEDGENTYKVVFEYFSGCGMVLKYFLSALKEIQVYLEGSEVFEYHDRIESREVTLHHA